jgi:hypothetical protein
VVGVTSDQAGHAIADSLGGSGKLADANLFPVNPTINMGAQNAFEKRIANAINAKKDVCVVLNLQYDERDKVYPLRPIMVHYKAYIDGKEEEFMYDNRLGPGRRENCLKL